MLVWLSYLMLLILGVFIVWYDYTLIISTKDLIHDIWDTLFRHVIVLHDFTHPVYEMVFGIFSIIGRFFINIVLQKSC
jgi:hypothetical protein